MLDSEEIPETEQTDMKIKIGDTEVDVSSAQAAFDSYDADLQAKLAEAVAAKDAAEAKVKELEEELTKATSDEAMDAAVQKRLEAKKAEEERLAKLERVKAAYPSIALDGKSQDFIDALDLRIEADKSKDPEGLSKVQSDSAGKPSSAQPKAPKLSKTEKLRLERIQASSQPLKSEPAKM